MISRRSIIAAGFAVACKPLWATSARTEPSEARPAGWATPVNAPGVPNLHQVGKNFYRSAQPNADGFRVLASQFGVKTVVSLRAFNADEPLARGLDLKLVRYKIHTWHIEREAVIGALRSLRGAVKKEPALLHCQHGADRTGLVTALYRMLFEGWSKTAATDEMLNGKFGYHAIWGNIPRFIQRIDVEQLRQQVELY